MGATLVVDMAHIAGLVVGRPASDPVPHADVVTTTTHKTLRGPRGGVILCRADFAERVDKSVFPGLQGGPLMHVIAAKAVCFGEALTENFRAYQRRVVENARTLAAALIEQGFDLVSGGTDNHLMLVDLRARGMTGKQAEEALHRGRITVNKNAVPNDPQKPWITSGIRIGTPALTTRGFGAGEMRMIAAWIGAHPRAAGRRGAGRARSSARCSNCARASRCSRTSRRCADRSRAARPGPDRPGGTLRGSSQRAACTLERARDILHRHRSALRVPRPDGVRNLLPMRVG